ncbi:hypothetical protein HOLleu_34277 [Holothuria leucospilota]|uniref:Uncharacterized protein n=1 Tax=Holothuria leucospilota TaxID=206669 RepID=A0A9Q1BH19_HOLLE|nr:hypothetical protein HOLleu_34277 [Holothuria leucospilota]
MTDRSHGTLKNMLRALTPDQMKAWDVYIPHFLFAYREVPSAATGFSPFELLYSRQVRGPLSILKSHWDSPRVSILRNPCYLLKMRERMSEWMAEASDSQVNYQEGMKEHYDRNALNRVSEPGEKVLVFLPEGPAKLDCK